MQMSIDLSEDAGEESFILARTFKVSTSWGAEI